MSRTGCKNCSDFKLNWTSIMMFFCVMAVFALVGYQLYHTCFQDAAKEDQDQGDASLQHVKQLQKQYKSATDSLPRWKKKAENMSKIFIGFAQITGTFNVNAIISYAYHMCMISEILIAALIL